MSKRIVLFSVFLLSFLMGCQSPQSQEMTKSEPEVPMVPLEDLTFEWDTYLSNLHNRAPANHAEWLEELNRICAKHEDACEMSARSSSKKDKVVKAQWKEIKRFLKEENFSELKTVTVSTSLKFFGKLKQTQLLNYAETLLKDQSCFTSDMRHALGSVLEDFLPEDNVKSRVLSLYELNAQCNEGRTSALSAYRAAMLRLIDRNCDKALPSLQKVNASTEEYLKPRSLYWSWKCQGESPKMRAAASNSLPYFSYHRLLLDTPKLEKEPENLQATNQAAKLEEKTPVMMESLHSPFLNEFVRLAEKLLANQEPEKARMVLEKVRLEKIQEAESEYQIYWAYLLHKSQSGIRKFQILSSLINTHPKFRSRTVKNMLFPKSYFEFVEASSKKLDPWLVQALIRQESAFDPRARSRVGATGLMQLMPATARRIARLNRSQLKDPIHNVQAGVKFLEKLVDKFDGQVHLALAAYNAGPNKVDEWVKRYPTSDSTLFVDTIPYRETREYVAFILRNYHWYRSLNPESLISDDEASDPDSVLPLFY